MLNCAKLEYRAVSYYTMGDTISRDQINVELRSGFVIYKPLIDEKRLSCVPGRDIVQERVICQVTIEDG